MEAYRKVPTNEDKPKGVAKATPMPRKKIITVAKATPAPTQKRMSTLIRRSPAPKGPR